MLDLKSYLASAVASIQSMVGRLAPDMLPDVPRQFFVLNNFALGGTAGLAGYLVWNHFRSIFVIPVSYSAIILLFASVCLLARRRMTEQVEAFVKDPVADQSRKRKSLAIELTVESIVVSLLMCGMLMPNVSMNFWPDIISIQLLHLGSLVCFIRPLSFPRNDGELARLRRVVLYPKLPEDYSPAGYSRLRRKAG